MGGRPGNKAGYVVPIDMIFICFYVSHSPHADVSAWVVLIHVQELAHICVIQNF